MSSTGVANGATYDGWFGFDSIPVLNKSNPEVQSYFLTGPNNVSAYWLKQGSSGWRMDVMGDSSFPNGYWETFRTTVKGDEAGRVDHQRDVAEGQRPCCGCSAATAPTRP